MKSRWFAPICIAAMLLVGLVALPQLPEQVPIHWNFQGEVDGYGPRWLAVLLMPAISLAVIALFRLLPKHDPVSSNETNAAIMQRYGNWSVLFLLIIQMATLGNAVGLQFDFFRIVLIGVGMLFVAIGNEMGRLKPNSWAGIRAPWTIADEDVWRESNRMGGRGLVIAGLLTILFAVFLPANIAFFAMMISVLGAVIFMLGYSYWIAQKKRKSASS